MIDSHAHLNFRDFQNDYAEVIKRSFANGITAIINVGSNFATSQKAIEIARGFKNCYAAIGLHPIHVYPVKSYEVGAAKPLFNRVKDEDFEVDRYRNLINKNKDFIKAIGETGLDRFHGANNKEKQKEVLLEHLKLAAEFNLPVILHCRGTKDNPKLAYQNLLDVLRRSASSQRKSASGVIHCFSADWQVAQEFLNLGFYIGFTGIITYPTAGQELLEVVAKAPIEKILLETDCPFLAPQPVRGQRCEPWHIKYTAEKIAEIKNISIDGIIDATGKNSRDLFGL